MHIQVSVPGMFDIRDWELVSEPDICIFQLTELTTFLIGVFSVCVFSSLHSHLELRYGGFNCPKCLSKLCELPSECRICGLTLVSSPHLARSYHHLFPVNDFIEINSRLQEEEKSVY